MVKTLVVIPARYGSSRFPGKPLAKKKNNKWSIKKTKKQQKKKQKTKKRPRTSGLRTFARRTESNA